MLHSKSLKAQRESLSAKCLDRRPVGGLKCGGRRQGDLLRRGGRINRHISSTIDEERAPLPETENRKGAFLRSSRRKRGDFAGSYWRPPALPFPGAGAGGLGAITLLILHVAGVKHFQASFPQRACTAQRVLVLSLIHI